MRFYQEFEWFAHSIFDLKESSLEGVKKWITTVCSIPWVHYFVIQKQSHSIGILQMVEDSQRSVEVGFWLEPQYRKKGYMKQALIHGFEYVFHVQNLHRIYAICSIENHASNCLMQNFSFRKEGYLKEYYQDEEGMYWDCNLYAMLKKEYKKWRKQYILERAKYEKRIETKI